MLAEDAIKSAISNYYSKNPQAQRQATDLSSTPAASLNKSAAPASEVAGSDAVAAVSASSSMSPATASNTATA
jgi:predicted transcriptional regulator